MQAASSSDERLRSRRFLCRAEDNSPFAYVRGQNFYRCTDHGLWAHLRAGYLISARTGMPVAYQVGSYFEDLDTGTPLYYIARG